MSRATTVRFSDEMFARLDQASARTGMPVNSIVIAACLEWMQRHTPPPAVGASVEFGSLSALAPAPRWATIRRAVEFAAGKNPPPGAYPFESFTHTAQNLLTRAQDEAKAAGFSYIGTEHLLLAALGDPAAHSAQILASLGVTEETVRATLKNLLVRAKPPRAPVIIPTSKVKVVIELAFRLCQGAGDPRVSTGHILLALSVEGEGIAARVINDLGATRELIEGSMAELAEPEA